MASSGNLYRESQGNITVLVNGVVLPNDSWTTLTGGDATSSSNKTRPGGMGLEQELGGQQTRTDAVVTRQWSDALIAAFYSLDQAVGRAVTSVSFTPLSVLGSNTGQPSFTWTGILMTVTPPPINAGSDVAAFLSITIGLNQGISTSQN